MTGFWARVGLFVGITLLSACVGGGPVSNPVGRTVTWFSYVGGDDLREGCQPGKPDRYRFVYNGSYLEQIRTYDITEDAHGALVAGRVIGPANLAEWKILEDPFSPWRGVPFETRLDSTRLSALRQAWESSGPIAEGLELPSDSFFWTAAVCQGGEFHFNGWAYPSPEFAALTFPGELLRADTSGVALNPARSVSYLTLRDQEEAKRFRLKLGENGLARW